MCHGDAAAYGLGIALGDNRLPQPASGDSRRKAPGFQPGRTADFGAELLQLSWARSGDAQGWTSA